MGWRLVGTGRRCGTWRGMGGGAGGAGGRGLSALFSGRTSWRGWGGSILNVLLFDQPAGTGFPRTFDDILRVGDVEDEDTRVLGLTTGYVQSIPSYCCFSIPHPPPRRRFSTPRNLHLLISPEPATPLALKHRTLSPRPPQLCSPFPSSFASYPSTLISLRPRSSSSSSVRVYGVLVIDGSTAGGSTRLWT